MIYFMNEIITLFKSESERRIAYTDEFMTLAGLSFSEIKEQLNTLSNNRKHRNLIGIESDAFLMPYVY